MKFRHPSVTSGSIAGEDGTYNIVDGVVDCPEAFGHAQGFARLSTEASTEPDPNSGPTLEAYVAAGYPADKYPPHGFYEQPSAGLTAFRAEQQAAAAAAAANEAAIARVAAIAKVLEGTVPEVEAAVSGPVEGAVLTLDELTQLEALEAAAKARKGVLDAITARREEILTAPPQS